MLKPELIAIASAALIVSGTALAEARSAASGKAITVLPVTPPSQTRGVSLTLDLARDLGAPRRDGGRETGAQQRRLAAHGRATLAEPRPV